MFSIVYCFLKTHDLLEADSTSIVHNFGSQHIATLYIKTSPLFQLTPLSLSSGWKMQKEEVKWCKVEVCNEMPPMGRDRALVVSGEGGVVCHCPDWCRNKGWMLVRASFSLTLKWCLVLVECLAVTCRWFTCLVGRVWLQHKIKHLIWLNAETRNYTSDKDCKYLRTETAVVIMVAVSVKSITCEYVPSV